MLAGFTHGRGLALLLPAAVAVALRLWNDRGRDGARRETAVVAVALGAVRLHGRLRIRGDERLADGIRGTEAGVVPVAVLSPEARVHVSYDRPPDDDFRRVITERFYGAFAQLEVGFSPSVYDALWWAMGIVAIGAIVAVALRRRELRAHWDVALVLASAVFGLLLLLHAVAYRAIVADPRTQ